MIEFIKMEVVWNEGQNFSTVREKLDKFSTGRGNKRTADSVQAGAG
jgi:hypothetical protein